MMQFDVCCDWSEIAHTMRDSVFKEHEEQLIDIHDVKVCECFPCYFYIAQYIEVQACHKFSKTHVICCGHLSSIRSRDFC